MSQYPLCDNLQFKILNFVSGTEEGWSINLKGFISDAIYSRQPPRDEISARGEVEGPDESVVTSISTSAALFTSDCMAFLLSKV